MAHLAEVLLEGQRLHRHRLAAKDTEAMDNPLDQRSRRELERMARDSNSVRQRKQAAAELENDARQQSALQAQQEREREAQLAEQQRQAEKQAKEQEARQKEQRTKHTKNLKESGVKFDHDFTTGEDAPRTLEGGRGGFEWEPKWQAPRQDEKGEWVADFRAKTGYTTTSALRDTPSAKMDSDTGESYWERANPETGRPEKISLGYTKEGEEQQRRKKLETEFARKETEAAFRRQQIGLEKKQMAIDHAPIKEGAVLAKKALWSHLGASSLSEPLEEIRPKYIQKEGEWRQWYPRFSDYGPVEDEAVRVDWQKRKDQLTAAYEATAAENDNAEKAEAAKNQELLNQEKEQFNLKVEKYKLEKSREGDATGAKQEVSGSSITARGRIFTEMREEGDGATVSSLQQSTIDDRAGVVNDEASPKEKATIIAANTDVDGKVDEGVIGAAIIGEGDGTKTLSEQADLVARKTAMVGAKGVAGQPDDVPFADQSKNAVGLKPEWMDKLSSLQLTVSEEDDGKDLKPITHVSGWEFGKYSIERGAIILSFTGRANYGARAIVRNTETSGIPVYIQNAVSLSEEEIYKLVESGSKPFREAAENGKTLTPKQAYDHLETVELTPQAIKRRVSSGEISVQQGDALRKTFYNIDPGQSPEDLTSDDAFNKWINSDGKRFSSRQFKEGTADEKLSVVSKFLTEAFRGASDDLLHDPNEWIGLREAVLSRLVPQSSIQKTASFAKEAGAMAVGGIAGFLTDIPATVVQYVGNAFGAQSERLDMKEEGFAEWMRGVKLNTSWEDGPKAGSKHSVEMHAALASMQEDHNMRVGKGLSSDEIPEELAVKFQNAALSYQEYEVGEIGERGATPKDFDIRKDPILQAYWQDFRETGQQESLKGLLRAAHKDTKSRSLEARQMAFTEKAEPVTAKVMAKRLDGLGYDPALSPQLVAAALAARDGKKGSTEKALKAYSKLLDLDDLDQAGEALLFLGADKKVDPLSIYGNMRGMWGAGYQEHVIELASSMLGLGIGKVAGSALVKAATGTTRTVGNTAKKAAFSRGMSQLFGEDAAFRTISRLGRPVSTLGKVTGSAGVLAKAMIYNAPIEGSEEIIAGIGELGSSTDDWLEQGLKGAVGGGASALIFMPVGVISQYRKNTKVAKEIKLAREEYADRLTKEIQVVHPDFAPITIDEVESAAAILNEDAYLAMQQNLYGLREQREALLEGEVGKGGQQEMLFDDLDSTSAEILSAEADVQARSALAIASILELRSSTEADRALYTAAAKVSAGNTVFTEAEGRAIQENPEWFSGDAINAPLKRKDAAGEMVESPLELTPQGRVSIQEALPQLGEFLQNEESLALSLEQAAQETDVIIAEQEMAEQEMAEQEAAAREIGEELDGRGGSTPGAALNDIFDPSPPADIAEAEQVAPTEEVTTEPVEAPAGPATEQTAAAEGALLETAIDDAKNRYGGLIKNFQEISEEALATATPDGTIGVNTRRMTEELSRAEPEDRKRLAEKVIEEEVIHLAQFKAEELDFKDRGRKGETLDQFRTRRGKALWDDFTDAQKESILEARKEKNIEGEEWRAAYEGVRMVVQKKRGGTITEQETFKYLGDKIIAELQRYAEVLRDLVTSNKATKRIKDELTAVEGILAEAEGTQTAPITPESADKNNLPSGTVVSSNVYASEGDITIQSQPYLDANGALVYDAGFSASKRTGSIAATQITKVVSLPEAEGTQTEATSYAEQAGMPNPNAFSEPDAPALQAADPESSDSISRHKLQVQRGDRAVGQSYISAKENEAVKKAISKSVPKIRAKIEQADKPAEKKKLTAILKQTTVAGIRKRIAETKRRHPKSDGWVVPIFKGIDKNFKLEYFPVPYTFEKDKNGKIVQEGSKEYAQKVLNLSHKIHQEIKALDARTDDNAKNIISQASWYKEMRTRLRQSFGGLGDLFADLLGATSPNTPVRTNWNFAIEALGQARRGDFDALIPQWEEWQNNADAAYSELRNWVDGKLAEGMNQTSIQKLPEFTERKDLLTKARALPDKLSPRKSNGAKFGFNGKHVVRAMLDLWRVVKAPDTALKIKGTSPKALNFSGNLIGFRSGATIDVWAARLLQRMNTPNVRIPSVSEKGVGGAMLEDGSTTQQFGLGQDVFKSAAAMIRNDQSLKNKNFKDLGEDDLQAIVWFLEKEVWTNNNWTSSAGEGGSFEFEMELEASSQKSEIKRLNKIADSTISATPEAKQLASEMIEIYTAQREQAREEHRLKSPNAKGDSPKVKKLTSEINKAKSILKKLSPEELAGNRKAALAALEKMRRDMDYYTAGVTTAREDTPTDADMAKTIQRIDKATYHNASSEFLVASKVHSTLGRYRTDERSIDLEVVAREGYDIAPLWNEIVSIAEETDQDSVYLARRLLRTEKFDPLQHRTGLSVYFREKASATEIEDTLDQLNKLGVGFFTMITEGQRTQAAQQGEMPGVVGVRMFSLPEFDAPSEWASLTDEQIVERQLAARKDFDKKASRIMREVPLVNLAEVGYFEINTRFTHEYATSRLDRQSRQLGGRGWTGRSVREAVEAANSWNGKVSESQGEGAGGVLRAADPVLYGNAEGAAASGGRRRSKQAGDGRGRLEGRSLTPLEGSPVIKGATGPIPALVEVAESYAEEKGIPLTRQSEYVTVDEDLARRISDAYEEMEHAPENPVVAEAYQNLIRQLTDQYRSLEKAGYKFWFIDLNREDNAEYSSSPYNAIRDLRKNKEMGVFPTKDGFGTDPNFDASTNLLLADTGIQWPVGGLDGELASVSANDLFRAVHDAFGHGLEGAGFRARGEENAWQAHVRLFTGSAIGALTSETRGQNSWLNYGPHGETNRTAKVEDTIFADNKTGLMPEWTWTEGRLQARDPEAAYARHAELEAKNEAGTITPEETAEAQRMVDEAAKKAGANPDFRVKRGDGKAFDVFDANRRGESTKAASAKKAFFFTKTDSAAETFGWMSANNEAEVVMKEEQKVLAEKADAARDKVVASITQPLLDALKEKKFLSDQEHRLFSTIAKTGKILPIARKALERSVFGGTALLHGVNEIAKEVGVPELDADAVSEYAEVASKQVSISSPMWLVAREEKKKELGLEEKGVTRDFYLFPKGNVQEINYGGKTSREGEITYTEAIDEALAREDDAVIFRNTKDAGEVIDIYAIFSPNQIKSADPFTGVPLSERFDQGSDSILQARDPEVASRVTPEQDQAYLDAVEAGDTEAAQAMLDEAARAAGLVKIKANMSFYTNKRDAAIHKKWFSAGISHITNMTLPIANAVGNGDFNKALDILREAHENEWGQVDSFESVTEYYLQSLEDITNGRISYQDVDEFLSSESRGFRSPRAFLPFTEKTTTPIIRDNTGRVIPLSQRFDQKSDSTLYAPDPKQRHNPPEVYKEAVNLALSNLPANLTKVYASISKGEDIGEISKKHNVNATAIANIKATVEARIEANLRVLASNSYKARTISSESESPMYKGGGRPDLALGAEAAFVRADQILNDKGVHVKVTFSEMNAMANQMFVNDPAGATKLVKEYIKSRGNNLSLDIPPKLNRFIKNSNAANYTSALMTTAAKLLVSDLMLKGRNKTVEDKMEITDLVIGYRTMGSDQARALAARRDPHKSPAQRAAMFLAEGLFEPDKRTLHLMGSSKNPEAIQEQWLEKTETMKEQLKAKGIDLDLILEQHQESMATKTELPQFLQSEVAKVDRKTRSIIEVFQDGGTPKMAREAAGVSLQEAKALYTAFYDKVNEAGVEAARAYSEAALAAKAPLSFAEQIGLHNPNIFDNEEAFPTPTSTSATPHNGDYNLNDSNDVEKIGQNLDNYKADIIDKIFQYRNMSILSGLQTHIVNVGSGIAYGAYEMIIKKAGVAMMNSGLNLVGQGSADAPTLPELKNLPPSFFKGISVGARMALKSYREDKRLFKKEVLGFDEDQHKKTGLKGEGNIPVPDNFYAKLLRAVSYRALTAADEGIKMWVATMEAPAQAHRIAKKEGLKPGTAAFDKRFKQLMKHDSIAWEAAVDMAAKVTFQTKLGEYVTTNNVRHWEGSERGLDRAIDLAAGKIQKGKFGSYGPIVKFMLQAVAPFVPTPANIYKLGFQMSPLGAFESMIDGMREIGYRKKYGAASGKIMTRARAIDDAANQVLVWSSLWVLREMMQPDDDSESPYYGVPFVTGSIGYKGTNRAERDLAYRINMPPHSIRLPAALGGHVVPYGRIEPFATALSTAVDMLAAWDRGETMPASALLFLQTVKDGAKQKTFLQGIADLANVWEDPERWGQRAISNLVVGFAPNAFIQAKNTLDPNIAETSVKGDLPFTGQVAKLVQRRVAPGADFWIFDPIPAKHSIWGEPIKRYPGDPEPSETTLLWKLYRLASPVKNIKAGEPFDVDLYIRSYNEQFPENDWTPAPPRRYIDVREGQAKSRYWLSDSEYESYIKKGGGEAKRMLDGFTWDWENPTIEGIEKIKKVYEKAYKFARDDIKSEKIDYFMKDIRKQR